MKSEDSFKFVGEYLAKILERDKIINNFRPIDMNTLIDQVLYDLVFI
jgi:hypothetical protein